MDRFQRKRSVLAFLRETQVLTPSSEIRRLASPTPPSLSKRQSFYKNQNQSREEKSQEDQRQEPNPGRPTSKSKALPRVQLPTPPQGAPRECRSSTILSVPNSKLPNWPKSQLESMPPFSYLSRNCRPLPLGISVNSVTISELLAGIFPSSSIWAYLRRHSKIHKEDCIRVGSPYTFIVFTFSWYWPQRIRFTISKFTARMVMDGIFRAIQRNSPL